MKVRELGILPERVDSYIEYKNIIDNLLDQDIDILKFVEIDGEEIEKILFPHIKSSCDYLEKYYGMEAATVVPDLKNLAQAIIANQSKILRVKEKKDGG